MSIYGPITRLEMACALASCVRDRQFERRGNEKETSDLTCLLVEILEESTAALQAAELDEARDSEVRATVAQTEKAGGT